MPLSPEDNRPGNPLQQYLAGWKAIEKMVHRGGSWSGHERNCAYLNTGGKRFANVSGVTGWDFDDDSRGVALVDWDADGDQDVWVGNRTSPRLRLLRNEADVGAAGNRWVAFKLEGTTCNRNGIGARVEVHSKGQPRLVQTLYAGDGFISQSSQWLHFGLGREPQLEKVTVRWPGGGTEAFTGIEPNRRYVLKQDRGQPASWTPVPRPLRIVAGPQPASKPTANSRAVLPDPYPLPLLVFTNFDGRPITGMGVGGTNPAPLLINLWATWCPPCLAELRELTAGTARLRAAGLEVVALSVDGLGPDASTGPAQARSVLEGLKFPFRSGTASPEWLEKMEIVTDRLFDRHIDFAVPTSFLLDARGNLYSMYRGPVSVETLLEDVKHLGAGAEERRNLAAPFAGSWYSKPGRLLLELMAADLQERFPAEAVRYLEIALRESAAGVNPANPGSRERMAKEQVKMNLDLARLFLRLARGQEAVGAVQAALAVAPDNSEALTLLAELRRFRGEIQDAIDHYRRVLSLQPDQHEIADRLAWILAAHPEARYRSGQAAVTLAETAVRATQRKNFYYLQTLAAAYAEAGRFQQAIATARQSVELAQAAGLNAKVTKFAARQKLYELNQPYRTTGVEPAREP